MSSGLVLDLDDTLYPRDRFVHSALAAVAHHLARTCGLDAQDVYSAMMRAVALEPPRDTFQTVARRYDLPAHAVAEMLDVYRTHEPRLWLSHGVARTLGALRAGGWRMAILTNGLPSVQARKVEALRLAALVDAIVYAEDVAPGGKPSGQAFRAALDRLGAAPEDSVCVGDDPVCDVAGARAIGMRTVRVARAHTVGSAGDADVVIESFHQLPGVVASLVKVVVPDAA